MGILPGRLFSGPSLSFCWLSIDTFFPKRFLLELRGLLSSALLFVLQMLEESVYTYSYPYLAAL